MITQIVTRFQTFHWYFKDSDRSSEISNSLDRFISIKIMNISTKTPTFPSGRNDQRLQLRKGGGLGYKMAVCGFSPHLDSVRGFEPFYEFGMWFRPIFKFGKGYLAISNCGMQFSRTQKLGETLWD